MKQLDAAKLAELRVLHDASGATPEDAKSFAYHAHVHFPALLECAERVAECEREVHTARNLAQEEMAKGVMKDKRIKILEGALSLAHDYLAGNGWEGDPRMEPIISALENST